MDTISRRRFLRDATLSTAAAAELLAAPSFAARRRGARTVAVLGGGVAGLTAAHELAERGFDVTLFERRALGGKARSIPVPGSAGRGRRPLPGEHGYRIEFGFYHNLPDTLRRIPVPGQPNGVHDSLVDVGDALGARDGGREGFHSLLTGPIEPLTVDALRRELVAAFEYGGQLRRPDEPAFLARQVAMYMTSSPERRLGQWEHVSWWDYMRADRMSEEYRAMWVQGLSEIPNALKAHLASTRTVAGYVEAGIYTRLGRGADGQPFRVLNAPTNEAWIDPWVAELKRLGVRFRVGHAVEALELRRGRIAAVRVRDDAGRIRTIAPDYVVCALPVERARRLWTRAIRAADLRLANMDKLQTAWLTGIQFFLREQVPVQHGHVAYVDSPWKVSSISQAQFWARDFARNYGNGDVKDCLSACIANWETPGPVFGKPARECTRPEIAREVWTQIKAGLEPTGMAYLPDEILHSWFLDPGIHCANGRRKARNEDSLFQNLIGTWEHRPDAVTAIPNLMLAGDYVRTGIDVATMEGANESARAAVNGILSTAGSHADAVPVFDQFSAPELEPLKRADAELFRQGLPHALDKPWPGT